MNSVNYERIENTLSYVLLMKKSNHYLEVDINYTNQQGKSLLHFACEHGLENLCDLLIKLGANLNIVDNWGNTPLMTACKLGHSKIVNRLLFSGADPNLINDYGTELLSMTLLHDDMELFLKIINLTQIHIYNSILGRISLTAIACALGKSNYLKVICSKSPNYLNAPVEKSGMTPLMLAVSGSFPETVRILLDYRADAAVINSYSMTSLDIARSLNDLKIEKMLYPNHKNWPNFNFPSKTQVSSSPVNDSLQTNTPKKRSLLDTSLSNTIKSRHPLTPNIYLSPKPNSDSERSNKARRFFQFGTIRRRSKSVENKTAARDIESNSKDVLEYILISTKLYECWPLFKSHEINFQTFLTMSEEDLKSIGILKNSLRTKLLKVIKHNKRMFC